VRLKHPLSERETQVTVLVCDGLPDKLIADRLKISEHRVRHCLGYIFIKTGVENRYQLVAWAFQNRVVRISTAKSAR
jgi:DNA-binding CsgD family transcriptional regulator